MTVATLVPSKPTSLTLLRRVTLSAARADVTFDHLEQDFENLRINVFGVNTNADATKGHVSLQFNGDTGSTYSWQEITHPGGGAVIGVELTSATSALIGFTGSAADPLVPGEASCVIYGYARSGKNKILLADEYARTPSTGFSTVVTFGDWWVNTAAIHTVRIFPEAGSWAANTVISVYGEP